MPAFSGQVPVCMSCGGRHVRPQASGDGLWPGGGEGVAWVCDTCLHIGAPLLVMPTDAPPTSWDRLFDEEAREVARHIEDEAWEPPRRVARPGRLLGALLLLLGAAFVLPALLALQATVTAGDLMGVLHAALPILWLLGVGVALLAVGLRLYRRAAVG